MKNHLPKFLAPALFSLAAAAATDNLNVKPGLWETTTTSQSQGPPPISPAQKAEMDKAMAKMSPEMRAKIEAAQKKSQANTPHVHKSCLTKEDLNKPMDFDGGRGDGKCTKTVLKSTSSVQEIRVDCKGDRYNSTGTIHIAASNSENWSGTLETTLTPVGKGAPMTVRTSMSGKWLGASCGDVKPAPQK